MEINGLTMDSFYASAGCMTTNEMKEAKEYLEYKLQLLAEEHAENIRKAIAAAIADGFDVNVARTETYGVVHFYADEDPQETIDIGLYYQWRTPLFLLNLC